MADPGPWRPADVLFPERRECIQHDLCVTCRNDAHRAEFETDLGYREYLISGLCEECQKGAFE